MLKHLLFFLVVLCPVLLFGQYEVPFYRNQVSAIRIFDPSQPRLELYERLHKYKMVGFKYISSHVSVAYLDNFFHSHESRIPKGFRLAFEEKEFFPDKSKHQSFAALELAYVRGRYPDFIVKTDTINWVDIIDSVKAIKQTLSGNIKIGVQFVFRPFVLEFSAGLGLKMRDSWQTTSWLANLSNAGFCSTAWKNFL